MAPKSGHLTSFRQKKIKAPSHLKVFFVMRAWYDMTMHVAGFFFLSTLSWPQAILTREKSRNLLPFVSVTLRCSTLHESLQTYAVDENGGGSEIECGGESDTGKIKSMSCQSTLTWTSVVFQSATSSSWQEKTQPIGTSSDQPRLPSKGLPLEVRACWDEECGRSGGRLEGVIDRIGVFPGACVKDLSTTTVARSQESHWSFRRLCVPVERRQLSSLATLSCSHRVLF